MSYCIVLIVAKCIVNKTNFKTRAKSTLVLIVAKCIVNLNPGVREDEASAVLIVAKCIVNLRCPITYTLSLWY